MMAPFFLVFSQVSFWLPGAEIDVYPNVGHRAEQKVTSIDPLQMLSGEQSICACCDINQLSVTLIRLLPQQSVRMLTFQLKRWWVGEKNLFLFRMNDFHYILHCSLFKHLKTWHGRTSVISNSFCFGLVLVFFPPFGFVLVFCFVLFVIVYDFSLFVLCGFFSFCFVFDIYFNVYLLLQCFFFLLCFLFSFGIVYDFCLLFYCLHVLFLFCFLILFLYLF